MLWPCRYIPPFLDRSKGLYGNQILHERQVFNQLNVTADSHMLDIGCGSGRVAHHAATFTGGRVSGFNIVESDIDNAILYANETGMDQRLDFKVGDHHKPFQYPDETFDASYSFEAVW